MFSGATIINLYFSLFIITEQKFVRTIKLLGLKIKTFLKFERECVMYYVSCICNGHALMPHRFRGKMAGFDGEFIDEWPPPAAPPLSLSAEEEERETASKRLKLSTEEEALITAGGKAEEEFSHLIRSSPSITADTLLARWWKDKTRKDEKFLLDVGATSSNPNTRLFHISR